jgi:hypothetical protein
MKVQNGKTQIIINYIHFLYEFSGVHLKMKHREQQSKSRNGRDGPKIRTPIWLGRIGAICILQIAN